MVGMPSASRSTVTADCRPRDADRAVEHRQAGAQLRASPVAQLRRARRTSAMPAIRRTRTTCRIGETPDSTRRGPGQRPPASGLACRRKYKRMLADRCRRATGSPRGLPPFRPRSARPIPGCAASTTPTSSSSAPASPAAPRRVACALAGLKPLVLEADRIGQAGRPDGRTAAAGPRSVVPRHRQAARPAGGQARLQQRGGARARRGGPAAAAAIPCGLEPRDSLTSGRRTTKGAAAGVRRARGGRRGGVVADAAPDHGVDAARRRRRPCASRDGFALDPYRACLGLAAAAVRTRRAASSSRRGRRRSASAAVTSRSSVDGGADQGRRP